MELRQGQNAQIVPTSLLNARIKLQRGVKALPRKKGSGSAYYFGASINGRSESVVMQKLNLPSAIHVQKKQVATLVP